MHCGWKGNHRSGIALSMRRRLSRIDYLPIWARSMAYERDEHHAYAPLKYYGILSNNVSSYSS